MNLDAAITDFLLARPLAERTEEWYFDKLTRFRTWAEAHGVTGTSQMEPALLRQFLAGLKDADGHLHRGRMTDQTIHGYARALRAFCYHLRDNGDYQDEWCRWWRKGMPKREVHVIKTFTDDHIHAMLLACSTQKEADRNRAILLFLLDTGVRASELCGLTLDHLHLGRESYATVFGKGRKQRTVGPLGRACQRQLIRYIEHSRRADCDNVFVNALGKPLDLNSLDTIIKSVRDVAGVKGVRCSCHTFRHTYAVHYLRQPGASIYKLRILLGHSTITTTEGYLRDFDAREARLGPSVVDSLRGK